MAEFGNENGKYTYRIPFQWKVFDDIEIKADSLEEAVQWAFDNMWKLGPTTDPTYAEDSFDFDVPDTGSVEEVVDYLENHRNVTPEE